MKIAISTDGDEVCAHFGRAPQFSIIIIEGNKVFAVEDSTLSLQDVEVIRKGVKSALIRGIANGTQILSEPVNNAYDGMLITPQK